MTRATYRRESSFGLRVPEDRAEAKGGSNGSWDKTLRAHLFTENTKWRETEAEERETGEKWKWRMALKTRNLPPVTHLLQQGQPF